MKIKVIKAVLYDPAAALVLKASSGQTFSIERPTDKRVEKKGKGRQLTMKDICAFIVVFLYASQIGCFPGSSDWGHMQPDLLGDSALQPPERSQAIEQPCSLKSQLQLMRLVGWQLAGKMVGVFVEVETAWV